MVDMNMIGWQSLVLADGRKLEPHGIVGDPAFWFWTDSVTDLRVSITTNGKILTLHGGNRRPNDYDVRQVSRALGIDMSATRPGPFDKNPRVRNVLLK